MADSNQKVDSFINRTDEGKQWQEAFKKLRAICLDCGLTEDFKWMHPCYTAEGGNICIIHGFKEFCAIMFPKGVLLDDPAGVLVAMTENTQAARQIRFTNVGEVIEMEDILKDYIKNAVEVEQAGLEVPFKDTSEFDVPEEFQEALDENPELREAFEALTPGRQRGYLLYFSGAKQSETRESRVEKYTQHILDGKGLNDQ